MSILELTPAHPLWADYCAHLSDAEQARWVLDKDNQPLQDALIFLAALQKTRQLGCFQMRSWSSLDKPANYQLKLNLGFAFQPEIQVTPSGLKVSGGYFIRTV